MTRNVSGRRVLIRRCRDRLGSRHVIKPTGWFRIPQQQPFAKLIPYRRNPTARHPEIVIFFLTFNLIAKSYSNSIEESCPKKRIMLSWWPSRAQLIWSSSGGASSTRSSVIERFVIPKALFFLTFNLIAKSYSNSRRAALKKRIVLIGCASRS
jgi:hypothetical protein